MLMRRNSTKMLLFAICFAVFMALTLSAYIPSAEAFPSDAWAWNAIP